MSKTIRSHHWPFHRKKKPVAPILRSQASAVPLCCRFSEFRFQIDGAEAAERTETGTDYEPAADCTKNGARRRAVSGECSAAPGPLHSLRLARFSGLPNEEFARLRLWASCNDGESPLRHSQFAPAIVTSRYPRRVPLDRRA